MYTDAGIFVITTAKTTGVMAYFEVNVTHVLFQGRIAKSVQSLNVAMQACCNDALPNGTPRQHTRYSDPVTVFPIVFHINTSSSSHVDPVTFCPIVL